MGLEDDSIQLSRVTCDLRLGWTNSTQGGVGVFIWAWKLHAYNVHRKILVNFMAPAMARELCPEAFIWVRREQVEKIRREIRLLRLYFSLVCLKLINRQACKTKMSFYFLFFIWHWFSTDQAYVQFHDERWGVPEFEDKWVCFFLIFFFNLFLKNWRISCASQTCEWWPWWCGWDPWGVRSWWWKCI